MFALPQKGLSEGQAVLGEVTQSLFGNRLCYRTPSAELLLASGGPCR